MNTAHAQPVYLRQERAIEVSYFGVVNLTGIAFSPVDGALVLLDAGQPGRIGARTIKITTLADFAGAQAAGALGSQPASLALDPRAGRLFAFDRAAGEIVALGAAHDNRSWRKAVGGRPWPFGAAQQAGLAVDAIGRRLLALDASSSRIVAFPLELQGQPRSPAAIDIRELNGAPLRGLAVDPATGHLYTFDQARQVLIELTRIGQIVSVRDLAPLRVGNLQGMVFAPSGDPTDERSTLNLYIADGGSMAVQTSARSLPRIVEVALQAPAPAPIAASAADLVRVIDSSAWSPPSPDPSGITYLPASGQLLISDAEVDEMPEYFSGDNLFAMTPAGGLVATYSTIAFTNEPTDVAINPGNGHLFFSHDGHRKIYEVDVGPDKQYGTSDDSVTSFGTAPFGCVDPEGLAFGGGRLFIADGLGKEIFIVEPGPNGHFDGADPEGDDKVSHFDTSRIGQPDPEGVEFDPNTGTLFIVSNDRHASIAETTTSGELLSVIDISSLSARAPAGLAYAPGSRDSSARSLYIVDRGVDNNVNPHENDGRIFEIALGAPSPPTATQTIIASATPRPTRTPKPTATPRPTRTPKASPQPRLYLPLIRNF